MSTTALLLFFGAMAFASAAGVTRTQKFFRSTDWDICMGVIATKSADYGRASLAECDSMDPRIMGKICTGPVHDKVVVPKLNPGVVDSLWVSCSGVTCPATHQCVRGMTIACCRKEFEEAKKEAISEKCPNGAKAAGVQGSYEFVAHVGKTCGDLICGKTEKCVQINKHFAKCCGAK